MVIKTEQYQLNKPEPQDGYDIADFNNNADILDRALKAVADSVPANLADGGASGSLRGAGSKPEDQEYQLGKNAVALGTNTEAVPF